MDNSVFNLVRQASSCCAANFYLCIMLLLPTCIEGKVLFQFLASISTFSCVINPFSSGNIGTCLPSVHQQSCDMCLRRANIGRNDFTKILVVLVRNAVLKLKHSSKDVKKSIFKQNIGLQLLHHVIRIQQSEFKVLAKNHIQ